MIHTIHHSAYHVQSASLDLTENASTVFPDTSHLTRAAPSVKYALMGKYLTATGADANCVHAIPTKRHLMATHAFHVLLRVHLPKDHTPDTNVVW